jgi:hypothetical protein
VKAILWILVAVVVGWLLYRWIASHKSAIAPARPPSWTIPDARAALLNGSGLAGLAQLLRPSLHDNGQSAPVTVKPATPIGYAANRTLRGN